eukprot:EG_transcript_15692
MQCTTGQVPLILMGSGACSAHQPNATWVDGRPVSALATKKPNVDAVSLKRYVQQHALLEVVDAFIVHLVAVRPTDPLHFLISWLRAFDAGGFAAVMQWMGELHPDPVGTSVVHRVPPPCSASVTAAPAVVQVDDAGGETGGCDPASTEAPRPPSPPGPSIAIAVRPPAVAEHVPSDEPSEPLPFQEAAVVGSTSSPTPAHASEALYAAPLCPTDPEAYVRCHNAKRRLHGVPDVRWSAAAAESAAAWARQGRFQHSDVTEYGENLYRSDSPPLPEDVVNSWYSEIELYDFADPVPDDRTGHFTQVVWRAATQVGCAVVRLCSGRCMVVCHYSPPGNFVRTLKENVPPLLPQAHGAIDDICASLAGPPFLPNDFECSQLP